MRRIAKGMRRLDLEFDLFFSPHRARQTNREIVVAEFDAALKFSENSRPPPLKRLSPNSTRLTALVKTFVGTNHT